MIYRAKMPEAYARVEWCKEQFGETGYGARWRRSRGCLVFNHEQDYLLYLLRWS